MPGKAELHDVSELKNESTLDELDARHMPFLFMMVSSMEGILKHLANCYSVCVSAYTVPNKQGTSPDWSF